MDRSFDIWDNIPRDMRIYLQNFGMNFNDKLCEFAVSKMRDSKGEKKNPIGKEKVKELLTKYGVSLKNDNGYNSTYVVNMAMNDYYGSSIKNENDLALFVKDFIDDEDANVGTEKPFRYFFAMCMGQGVVIDWNEMI